MVELTMLGCGGTQPLPGRALAALWLQVAGSGLLFDCGEGTQAAARRWGCSLYKLDAMENDFHAERVSLRQAAKDSINELKSSFIERGIFPKLEAEEQLVVYSDSKWLRFVLYQLLTNALKYSDAGSAIVVKAYDTPSDIVLCVEDSGCGIAPEDLPRIFDLFFTGQNGRLRGESSGLGLYMVKQILDDLGHSIQVTSSPGKGSRFQVLFSKRAPGETARKIAEL